MYRFKVYTSKGIKYVDNVTCPLNAEGVVKKLYGQNTEVYDLKEIDDYEYAEEEYEDE
ncbi:MAG: hypothetical protein ACI4M6_05365 [Christensenellaceae bacterium]